MMSSTDQVKDINNILENLRNANLSFFKRKFPAKSFMIDFEDLLCDSFARILMKCDTDKNCIAVLFKTRLKGKKKIIKKIVLSSNNSSSNIINKIKYPKGRAWDLVDMINDKVYENKRKLIFNRFSKILFEKKIENFKSELNGSIFTNFKTAIDQFFADHADLHNEYDYYEILPKYFANTK